jgi:pimeloyl-ACP methyl ester carboxylesterase
MKFFVLISIVFAQFFSVVATAAPAQNSGQTQAGLVEVNGRKLYTQYSKAKNNKPTLIFVNGLTYSTKNWWRVVSPLIQEGYGILLFDMWGMGTTLLSNSLPNGPIPYKQQVADIKALLTKLRIRPPYNFVGLSYGGGILASYTTAFPRDIKNLILIAPYTEFLQTQKDFLLKQIKWTRQTFPNNSATDDQLTDYFIRQLVYTTYPMAEVSSLENPFKLEGITRIVQGIRTYQPIEETRSLPQKSLHLILAENDQYIPKDIFLNYWNAVPQSAKASRVFVQFSEHKLPDAFPRFTTQLIKGIVNGQPMMYNGDTFVANPVTLEFKKSR